VRNEAVLPAIVEKRSEVAALCRRYGVLRLDVFGSAARGADFDAASSDIDFLVELSPSTLDHLIDLQRSLETLFHRPVDLVSRRAVEGSRNYIRRRHILEGAQTVYAA
jgi:uncharacterized protein